MTSVTYADLKGKVVLITGSSKALGAETARQFAASGARVVVNGRDEQAIERVTCSIGSEGGECNWHSMRMRSAFGCFRDRRDDAKADGTTQNLPLKWFGHDVTPTLAELGAQSFVLVVGEVTSGLPEIEILTHAVLTLTSVLNFSLVSTVPYGSLDLTGRAACRSCRTSSQQLAHPRTRS